MADDQSSDFPSSTKPLLGAASRAQAVIAGLLTEPLAPGLYLVATPIGNLGDITLRALSVLTRVDVIYCEDTRHSAKLLHHYAIATRTRPFHDHNEEREAERVIAELNSGKRIAIISDAGTPLLSDPGFKLVRAAAAEGVPVFAIPGASALLSALTTSGLPTDAFFFAGFLPPKQAARQTRLAELAQILALLDQRDLQTLAHARIDVREEEKGGDPGASDEDDDDTLPRDALFQVRDADGHVLAGSPQLVALHAWDLAVPAQSGAWNISLGGKLWHTFTLRDTLLGHTVRVFEPANTRSDLMSGVARRIARPLVIALPVLALLVWFSIGLSLSPLKTLSRAILRRDINKLEPVDIGRAPTEVRPLVDSINHVLSRLRDSLDRQRAFTADAAHELKTPLAAIKVQPNDFLVPQIAAE